MILKKNCSRNKNVLICLLVLICMIVIPPVTVRASSDVIENNNSGIPDKKLYKAILKELGKKKNQKFTKQEAESIKSLAIYSGKVKSLKGIKYLKELKNLDLEGAGLKNLKGIQDLKKLEKLNISHNYIKNLKPLKKLKNLKDLNASWNEIKSLKG